MPSFHDIQGFIIDMDGVIWRGHEILPGVREFFKLLQSNDLPFLVATNNSTAIPEIISKRFAEFGIKLDPNHVVTSSNATAQFVERNFPDIRRVYCIGEEGLQGALTSKGYHLTASANDAQAVIVGFDRHVNWSKLEEATLAIVGGAHFIGTNPDPSIPTERGVAPGSGAILAALQVATNVEPLIVGKPGPYIYLMAMERVQIEAHQTFIVGDRLETDIAGGIQAGMPTCLVLTGVTRREDLQSSPIQPDWVFNNLTEITAKLRKDRL
jgi:4-nitrophenyl phosphatase